MTNREFNMLLKRYEEQIDRDLSSGILHRNKDGNIKRLAAGNLKYIKKDNEGLISLSGTDDYIKIN